MKLKAGDLVYPRPGLEFSSPRFKYPYIATYVSRNLVRVFKQGARPIYEWHPSNLVVISEIDDSRDE